MAIVCYICKEEVALINFGNGLVGVCCGKVLYNSADKSQFDMKPDEKKDISYALVPLRRKALSSKIFLTTKGGEYDAPNKTM
jgi:hypothetical protein